jgi:outer membrane protein
MLESHLRSFAVNKLFLAVPMLALAALAHAQAPVTTKVGVIQVQAALAATKDGQAALDALDKRLYQPRRKEIEGKQTEVKDLQEKLQRGGNTMSQAAKDDLQRQIDQKSKNLNRDMQDAEDEIQGEQNKVVQELLAKMGPLVEKYAADNGFSLIVDVSNPNSGVFWAASGIDITQAVVDLYDKTAPTAAPAKPGAVKPGVTPVKPAVATPKPATLPAK